MTDNQTSFINHILGRAGTTEKLEEWRRPVEEEEELDLGNIFEEDINYKRKLIRGYYMEEEDKEERKIGKNSQFGERGWIFDKLFTKAGKLSKSDPTPTQQIWEDDPPYKQVTNESLQYFDKRLKGSDKQNIDKIADVVKQINLNLSQYVSEKTID